MSPWREEACLAVSAGTRAFPFACKNNLLLDDQSLLYILSAKICQKVQSHRNIFSFAGHPGFQNPMTRRDS